MFSMLIIVFCGKSSHYQAFQKVEPNLNMLGLLEAFSVLTPSFSCIIVNLLRWS